MLELEKKVSENEAVLCIVGLGYVGLPLAKHFSKYFKTIGFDINESKIHGLTNKGSEGKITFTSDPSKIQSADFVIVCVPTPVKINKEPDLTYLLNATKTVGENLSKDTVVVYESTVYPGATEEECLPILEKVSSMECGKDFHVGYSPERINPGDDEHNIDKITKIVSGNNYEVCKLLEKLYEHITDVYLAPNIKTAEAAKVIENIQRDLNIALMNELSIIFNKMGLDTEEVLNAAATKWNFHRYHPGLVGGHCIPVDPYYLVHKAKELDYHPQVILAGRSINDYMPKHVAEMAIKGINKVSKVIKGSTILILGLTYKENVADIRETPVKEIIKELKEYGAKIIGYDPYLDSDSIEEFGIDSVKDINEIKPDCIITAVSHDHYIKNDFINNLNKKTVMIDVKGIYKQYQNDFLYYKTL